MSMEDFQFNKLDWGIFYINNKPDYSKDIFHSYDAYDNCINWEVQKKYYKNAVDIEHESSINLYLISKYGINKEDFIYFWTRAETLAKILNIPIFSYLKVYGLKNSNFSSTELIVLENLNIELLFIKPPNYNGLVCFGRANLR